MSTQKKTLYAFILGKHPPLSIWEICAFLTRHNIEHTFVKRGKTVVIVKAKTFDPVWLMQHLGGTIKIAEVTEVSDITEDLFFDLLPKRESKLRFGMSWYNGDLPRRQFDKQYRSYRKFGRQIKEQLQAQKRSVRYVQGRTPFLSSVVVSKNGLIAKGAELVSVLFEDTNYIGVTKSVQSVRQYVLRDIKKPYRSMKVGMIPPKLARMMVNISGAQVTDTLLDPFCGTGTVLLEATSLGFGKLKGSDIASEQAKGTKKNIDWYLAYKKICIDVDINQADVRKLDEQLSDIDVIVTEPYLGPILRGKETPQEMQAVISELSELYLHAFSCFANILSSDATIVMVVPQFQIKGKSYHLPILEQIEKIGFTRVIPPEQCGSNHVYMRAGQHVRREIMVFKRSA